MSDKIVPTGASTYLRLLKYVRRYWLAFVVSIFGLVLHSFAEVAFVDLLGFITDTVGTLTSYRAAEANAVEYAPDRHDSDVRRGAAGRSYA